MTKLISFALTGLAAMLVIAFCCACGDEFSPARENSSFDLVNNARLTDSPMIEIWLGVPRFRGTVGKQRETVRASLLQTTSPAETGSDAICTDGRQSDRGQVEGFHG